MDGAADAALGAWASVRGFFTPATLFLVVNLVIGTIWLTSRSHQRRRRGNAYAAHDADADAQHHHQEQPFHHQQEHQYYDQQQHHEQQYVPAPPAPAPLARTSSVLNRLRSIGLYRFRSGDFPPEYAAAPATDSRDGAFSPAPAGGDAHHERTRSEPAPVREERRRPPSSRMKKSSSSSEAWKAEVAPAPAARVVRPLVMEEDDGDVVEYARADELTGGNSFAQQQQPEAALQHEVEEEEEQYYREEYVPPLRPAPLARAPSVLERLRSFSLSRFRSGDLAHEQADAAVEELERNHAQKQAAHYSRSSSEPSREQSKKGKNQLRQGTEPRMSKSSSEARKPTPAEEPEATEEGGVDARADDFINSFRKQLQLQRLNSLLNYKEMLNRGA